jgi:hypothetical protein
MHCQVLLYHPDYLPLLLHLDLLALILMQLLQQQQHPR